MTEQLEKTYMITKEACHSMISGVCKQCGGELEPIETVDNAGNPTYWGGCMPCQTFCWGVSKEVYQIAVLLVDERRHVAYSHMEHPMNKSDEYKKYYRESQIAGTCSIVMDVLNMQKKLHSEQEVQVSDTTKAKSSTTAK